MRDFYPESLGAPGIHMAYFNLREGRFRQSNLHLVKPARLGNRHYIEDLYEHRYQRQTARDDQARLDAAARRGRRPRGDLLLRADASRGRRGSQRLAPDRRLAAPPHSDAAHREGLFRPAPHALPLHRDRRRRLPRWTSTTNPISRPRAPSSSAGARDRPRASNRSTGRCRCRSARRLHVENRDERRRRGAGDASHARACSGSRIARCSKCAARIACASSRASSPTTSRALDASRPESRLPRARAHARRPHRRRVPRRRAAGRVLARDRRRGRGRGDRAAREVRDRGRRGDRRSQRGDSRASPSRARARRS